MRRPPRQKVYWRVPRDCEGETIFIIAGGTSVAGHDLSRLKGRRVMVVNSSFEAWPEADLLFFGDTRWWLEYNKRLGGFAGKIVTTARDCPSDPRLLFLKVRAARLGLSPGADEAALDRTSLQGAIDIAAKRGAARIVLLGADMCVPKTDDGKPVTHHHRPYPAHWTAKRRPGQPKNKYVLHMEDLRLTAEPLRQRGIEVFNCSPVSLIDWWPKADFNDMTRD